MPRFLFVTKSASALLVALSFTSCQAGGDHERTWEELLHVSVDQAAKTMPDTSELNGVHIDVYPPDLDKVRYSWLMNGSAVPLVSSTKAGKNARASCDRDGQLVVYVTPRPPDWWNPYVAAFLREHEFAHIKLGHVDCATAKTKETRNCELDADCEAARALAATGPDGVRLVLYMAGVFVGLDQNETKTHPSSAARAARLLTAACGKG